MPVDRPVISRNRIMRGAAMPEMMAPGVSPGLFSGMAQLPFPVLLLLLTLLLPAGTSFYVGPMRLTAYRLVLIAYFFPCLYAVLRGRAGRALWCDYLVLAHACWAFIALVVVHGIDGIQTGGIYLVEGAGAYLMTRRYIRNIGQFSGLVGVWTLVVVLLLCVTLPESLTGVHFLQPYVASIGRRYGFERAYGPFDHPILLGVYCASTLGLAWYMLSGASGRITIGRIGLAAVICFSSLMSVSSGTMAALFVQMILIGWETFTRRLRRRWWVLLGIVAFMYVFVDVFSNRTPITVALYYLTFNAETAYGRILIWDCGTIEVQDHPFFGIGNNSWRHPTWISDSVDNFWLCITMMYGLPAIIFLGGAIVYIITKLAKRADMDSRTAYCRIGWITSFAGLAIAGCTVHFWNSSFVTVMLLIGCPVWMIDASSRGAQSANAPRAKQFRRRFVPSRAVAVADDHPGVRRPDNMI